MMLSFKKRREGLAKTYSEIHDAGEDTLKEELRRIAQEESKRAIQDLIEQEKNKKTESNRIKS